MSLDRAITRGRGLEVAEPPLSALSAASQTVARGYYAATTLSAVDADHVPGNIRSGVTDLGVAGAATVQEIGAADAAVTDVKAPKTFFSVTGAIKTGTLATVALDPAANAYPAGYHVGAASLTAVDADLVTGNIKSGVTIFGVAGAATVQEIGAANAGVADVHSPATFFSVSGAIKTGTMPTAALDPALNAYPAGWHAGAASLTAVDADLAVGNIKSGVTIFGVLGTFDKTLSQDLVASAETAEVTAGAAGSLKILAVGAGATTDLATTTNNFAANSMAVAVGYMYGFSQIDIIELLLFMDGVQVATSGVMSDAKNWIVVGTKALSGNKICKVSAHSTAGADNLYIGGTNNGSTAAAGIGVGSIKMT